MLSKYLVRMIQLSFRFSLLLLGTLILACLVGVMLVLVIPPLIGTILIKAIEGQHHTSSCDASKDRVRTYD